MMNMADFSSDQHSDQKTSPAPGIVLRRILGPIFSAHWLRLLLGLLALVLVDLFQLTIPRLVQSAVDSLAAGLAAPPHLLKISGIICLLALCVAVLRFVWRMLILGFSRILEQKLRNRMFEHILTMDQPFFERWTTGDLMAHASNDLGAVQMACGMGMVAAVDATVMSSIALAFMLSIDVNLTLVALLPMPLLVFSTRALSARLHHRFNLVQEQFSLLTEFSRATLSSIRLIKGYTLERFQSERFHHQSQDFVRSNLKVAAIQGLLFPLATLVGNASMLLLLYYGGMRVMEGHISIGAFIAFISYLYMMVWPMMAVGWVANIAQRGLTSLRRIDRLLEEQAVVSTGTSLPFPEHTPNIYLCKNLSFTYAGAQHPALDNIELELRPGLLAVGGRTGSGKSTLCKLLMRLYPVPDGMLFFRGIDVNQLSQAELRKMMAYVSQEPALFAGTIASNIAFGRPCASMEEIRGAAAAAAIDEDIQALGDGYDSIIGERGVRLSGGQRQRLALARALLSQRPILIIDDALSAIDVETEQRVLRGIMETLRDRTVLLVSHRVNVLRQAKEIVLLDRGKIVARGKHEALLSNPLYRAMADKQGRASSEGNSNV